MLAVSEAIKNKTPLNINQIREIVNRAVDEGLKVLKEIDPQIHKLKYEKGDDMWILKDRLIMGIFLELMFMGLINHDTIY